jgi:hypothetical protein
MMSSRDQWDIIDWKTRCSELAFMIEDLENRNAELEERVSWLETTLDTVDAAIGRWRDQQ